MTLPEPLQQVDRTWVQWRGQTLAYFAGCDYFRMASHPAVLAAAHDALSKYGLNVAASRWTTGNHPLYNELEAALADFFGKSALLVSNGYLTNMAVVRGLSEDISHILIDERAHGSLFEAARVARCEIISFAHRNPADLQRKLRRGSGPLIMTDGVFAHDGSIAPLREYADMLPPDARLLVDDSHGAGVLGANGRGTPEFSGVAVDGLIQTITLSKAFGSYGGAIMASSAVCKRIADESPIVPGATPFPLPCAAAALISIGLLRDSKFRERLWENVAKVTQAKFPIHSIVPNNGGHRNRLKAALVGRGIFPPEISYGNGPEGGYFRFAISSEHTRAQLDALADALTAAM